MPITVSHALSMTTPDDPAYENQPQHWNQTHAASMNVAATEISQIFSNANGVSFGLNGTNITASHNALTSQSNQAFQFDAGAPTTFQTLSFADNYVFWSNPGDSKIYADYLWNLGLTAAHGIDFSNANGITFGYALGGDTHTITASHNGLTSQSNQAWRFNSAFAAESSGTFQTLDFYFGSAIDAPGYIVFDRITGTAGTSIAADYIHTIRDSAGAHQDHEVEYKNSNGISFGISVGAFPDILTITASHNGLTSQSNQALSGSNGSFTFQTATFGNSNGMSFYTTNGSMVGSYTVPTQSNQTVGLYAVGNTTGQSSSSTFDARTISFVGQGVASVGFSAGSVNISVPSGGGGLTNINISAGTTSQNLSNLVFSDANGVSFGLNGSTVTASVNAAGGGATLSSWAVDVAITGAGSNANNSSMSIVPFRLEENVSASQMAVFASISAATQTNTQSAGFVIGMSAVFYTKNGATLSSLNSASMSTSTFHQSNSTSSVANVRAFTMALASASLFTPGQYWMALRVSTTTSGATSLAKGVSMGVIPTWASGFGAANYLGANTTNTRGPRPGLAIHSTGATRASIAFTDITGHAGNSASLANLYFQLRNDTVW